MVISEVVTLFFYVVSMAFLPAYFGELSDCLLLTLITNIVFEISRSLICCDFAICMESSCHRRD
jgi:hypothetical protein